MPEDWTGETEPAQTSVQLAEGARDLGETVGEMVGLPLSPAHNFACPSPKFAESKAAPVAEMSRTPSSKEFIEKFRNQNS